MPPISELLVCTMDFINDDRQCFEFLVLLALLFLSMLLLKTYMLNHLFIVTSNTELFLISSYAVSVVSSV